MMIHGTKSSLEKIRALIRNIDDELEIGFKTKAEKQVEKSLQMSRTLAIRALDSILEIHDF